MDTLTRKIKKQFKDDNGKIVEYERLEITFKEHGIVIEAKVSPEYKFLVDYLFQQQYKKNSN